MNIYEVAEAAGVSIATVSRVMNNSGYVSEKTREKVEQIIREQHFTVSRGGTQNRKIGTVAAFAEDIRVPTHAAVIYGFESRMFSAGISVIVCSTGSDVKKIEQYLDLLLAKNVDAFFLSGTLYSQKTLGERLVKKLMRRPIIAVNSMQDVRADNVFHILRDEEFATEIAAEIFFSRGHRRVGIVDSSYKYYAGIQRINAFRRLTAEMGMQLSEKHIYRIESSYEAAYQQAAKIVEDREHPTALFVGQTWTAAGLVKGFREAGLRVPEDISVIGLTDSIYSKTTEPAITVVDFEHEKIGVAAATILEALGSDEQLPSDILVRPILIERGSVAELHPENVK